MDFKNVRPVKIIDLLHESGIWRQDIISVLYDLRLCIRFGLDKSRYVLLSALLPKLQLEMVDYVSNAFHRPTVLIGKRKSLLKKASLLDKKYQYFELGLLLGYPSCCVKFFMESQHSDVSLPELLLRNSRNNKLEFKLNFLYNFDTRARKKIFITRLSENKYFGWDNYLIPHIPCSFTCKESIRYAADLFRLMEKFFPSYAKQLKFYLKKKILFINDFKFAVVDGRFNKGLLYYRKIININNLLEKSLINIISKGNRLEILGDKIIISKGNLLVKKISLRTMLFNFCD